MTSRLHDQMVKREGLQCTSRHNVWKERIRQKTTLYAANSIRISVGY